MAKGISTSPATQLGTFREYILRRFVDMLVPEYVHARFAEPGQIPMNAGSDIAVWNVPQHRAGTAAALDQLTAGGNEVTGTTINQVTGLVQDFGDWFKISTLQKASALQVTLDSYAEGMADSGAQFINGNVRDAGYATTAFLHAGDGVFGGVALTAPDKLTLADFPVIAGYFRNNNGKGWKELSGDYALMIHPNVEVDLVTDVTTTALSWSEANKYVPKGFETLINNHQFVGRFNGVSAMRTTEVVGVLEDVSAYRCSAVARWGVGHISIGKAGPTRPTITHKMAKDSGTAQPIDRYDTLAWSVRTAAKLLDVNRVLVVYSAHTSA